VILIDIGKTRQEKAASKQTKKQTLNLWKN